MATAAVEARRAWDTLLSAWRELHLPGEGWRAEIEEQRIVLMPPPGELHNRIASRLVRMLSREVPYSWEIFETMGVQIPYVARLYVPDVAVFPAEVFPTTEPPVAAEHALLLVEITSPGNAEHDRKKKRWAYANAPVPLYLLVDPHDSVGPSATLYAEPRNGDYQSITKTTLGSVIELPEPFGFPLATAELPTE